MSTPTRRRALAHWRKMKRDAERAPHGKKGARLRALRSWVARQLSGEVKR